MNFASRTVIGEAEGTQLAIKMINLGARIQLLNQTGLSREKLIKLYKEIKHVSPPKGMLPSSDDWFIFWSGNIHSSIFMNIYQYMLDTGMTGIHAFVKAYEIYADQVSSHKESYNGEGELILSISRAWVLVRYIEGKILTMTDCKCCGGNYVVRKYDLHKNFICGMCNMPSRAGKRGKAYKLRNGLIDEVEEESVAA